MSQIRIERIARNESTFRSTNETLNRELHHVEREAGELAGFVCECGDLGCTVLVHLSLERYEEVRADSRRFMIAPGHEMLEAEEIVERGERYFVVQKDEAVRHIVEGADPRR